MIRNEDMLLPVTLEWNKATEQWRLKLYPSGETIQEFYDCPSFQRFFVGSSKEKAVRGIIAWKVQE